MNDKPRRRRGDIERANHANNTVDQTSSAANHTRAKRDWVEDALPDAPRQHELVRRGDTRNYEESCKNAERFRMCIYDPADLLRAIQALAGERDEVGYFGPEDVRSHEIETHLSNEETLRLRRLRLLGSDPRGRWRSLIHSTADMVDRLAAVRNLAPHFAPLTDLVTRAVQVASITDTPLRLPPVLLLGEPGIGKTFVAKKLAAAIGSSCTLFPMNITDSFRLRGLNTAWKAARPGRIAETLLAADTASPVIVLDELEKTPMLDKVDRPFDVWHSLWEPENSVAFVDDYYELPLRCDRVIWIASANNVDALPDSIVDRLLVLRIPTPNVEQVLAIIDNIYETKCIEFGSAIAELLSGDVRHALARQTPRRAGRILDVALGFMAADGRTVLCVSDIESAERVAADVRQSGTFRHPVGFRMV